MKTKASILLGLLAGGALLWGVWIYLADSPSRDAVVVHAPLERTGNRANEPTSTAPQDSPSPFGTVGPRGPASSPLRTELRWQAVSASDNLANWIRRAATEGDPEAPVSGGIIISQCEAVRQIAQLSASWDVQNFRDYLSQWYQTAADTTRSAAVLQASTKKFLAACKEVDSSLVPVVDSALRDVSKDHPIFKYMQSRSPARASARRAALIEVLSNPRLNALALAIWLETEFWTRDIGKRVNFTPLERALTDQLLFELLVQPAEDSLRKAARCATQLICAPETLVDAQQRERVQNFTFQVDAMIKAAQWDLLLSP